MKRFKVDSISLWIDLKGKNSEKREYHARFLTTYNRKDSKVIYFKVRILSIIEPNIEPTDTRINQLQLLLRLYQ